MTSGGTTLRGFVPKARTAIALHVPQYTVWGAGTDIGKSLVSAGICRTQTLKEGSSLLYLKPVQTGFPLDSDSRLVARVAGLQHTLSPHAASIDHPPPAAQQDTRSGPVGSVPATGAGAGRLAHTSFAWSMPASPHLAVQAEGRPVTAAEVLEATRQQLEEFTSKVRLGGEALALVETAGGVASPSPCGALQCDVLRPLRLPGLLVGDYRLGGISATVTAMESLLMRGYDTDLLVMLEGGLGNAAAVKSAFGLLPHKPIAVVTLPPPPGRELGGAEAVLDWCAHPQTAAGLEEILHILQARHSERVAQLHAAAEETTSCIWWPFTQHSMVAAQDVTVIDSRCGEHFTVLKPAPPELQPRAERAPGSLATSFDACASWWTQGVSAEQQVSLTRAIAYASGRYGHVMFPENTHAAALACAQSLLQGVGKGWASRVFYSDNGSTAIEVAVKMAFRKYIVDHGLAAQADAPEPFPELRIIGLEGCYHGDTLGAMDCQGPSSFTGNWQFPWYSGRGLWLEPATLAQRAGEWTIALPPHIAKENENLIQDPRLLKMPSRDAAFDVARDKSELADVYRRDVRTKLDTATDLAAKDNTRFGALLIEPVVQGAGGMLMIDPLYQRVLMQECKSRSIPVILDEVFCGLWRLGCETTIELLHETPDISWYLPSLQTHVAKVVGRVSFKTRTKMHFLGDTFKKQAYSRD